MQLYLNNIASCESIRDRKDFLNELIPRSRNSPVSKAFRDCETLKQWETNLAFAVTTRNLVAKARSRSNASRLLSRPRWRSPLNLHRCVCPAKLIESTSNSLKDKLFINTVDFGIKGKKKYGKNPETECYVYIVNICIYKKRKNTFNIYTYIENKHILEYVQNFYIVAAFLISE